MINQKQLKKYLTYNKFTGLFKRNINSGRCKKGDIAGYKHIKGYIYIGVGGGYYKAHRLAFLYVKGEWSIYGVDHDNSIKDDNRWCNLFDRPQSDNVKNACKRKDNSSGFTGVHWCNTFKVWKVQISLNKKRKYLGQSRNLGDAIRIRKAANIKYSFHKNHGK